MRAQRLRGQCEVGVNEEQWPRLGGVDVDSAKGKWETL